MLRSLLGWSLKPVLAISVVLVLVATFLAKRQPNIALIYSLSWDTGAITTSDVTVPLMLAIGAGLSRMGKSDENEGSGFGSVAMASLIPVLTVLILATVLTHFVPQPMTTEAFINGDQNTNISQLFKNQEDYEAWALKNLTEQERLSLFQNIDRHISQSDLAQEQQEISGIKKLVKVFLFSTAEAARAIIPLALMLTVIVAFILRRKISFPDEILLGVFFCLFGMATFTTGVEISLLPLGEQSGENLTSLFRTEIKPEKTIIISNFDTSAVTDVITTDGTLQPYFLFIEDSVSTYLPFKPENYDAQTSTYVHIPSSPPRIPGKWSLLVLMIAAFGLGFTTTLVEPAVAALGVTVENVTVGVFPRGRTIKIVSIGVGFGTLAGIAMLVWNIPLMWFLGPLYVLILIFTVVSSELFTGIAWDAGGATTASITTPLVLAIGAGLGGKLGIADSFGILTLASSFPILGVLVAGLFVSRGNTLSDGGK